MPRFSRRSFLKSSLVIGGASLIDPGLLLADPYHPVRHRALDGTPIRVRGRVASAGKGLPGVRVSDGLDVAITDSDGAYELITTNRRPFVFMSTPAGHEIPRGETGVASFFRAVRDQGRGRMTADFDLMPAGDDTRHAFLALGDTQTQTQWEMDRLHAESVPDIIDTLGDLGDTPVFGLACGDIMFDDLSLYPEYERAVRRIDRPFFQVVGNHDLDFDAGSDPGSVRTFERHFGPSYYSFDRGEVHYVVLDDVLWHAAGYIGHVGADQLTWLEADLATIEAGRTVVVFQHIPMFCTQHIRGGTRTPSHTVTVTNRQHLYRLLEPYEAHIISGHTHENEHVFEGGAHEHVLGTTCGAWWADDICHDGTPNGYAVYEVDGSRLTWRYKATGRPADEQIRVYPRGSDPAAPGEIVANVWDADPEWTVRMLVNGDPRGPMAPRVGLDPWTVDRFDGPDAPEHRPWVQPLLTSHLFYAPVEADASDILVEATDRFGRTYTARPVAW